MEAAHNEEIQLGGEEATSRTTSVTLTPGVEEASMAGRTRLTKSVLGLAAGVVLVAALVFSVSAASSQNPASRVTRAFHATKDCSGHAYPFCSVRRFHR